MFGWFEKLVDPFPAETPSEPPKQLLRFLIHYAKPTIAMVHGYCFGGACELAICCDLRIAAEGASFSVLIVNLNLSPVVYPPVYLVVAVLSALVIAHAERRVGLPATSSGRDSDSS